MLKGGWSITVRVILYRCSNIDSSFGVTFWNKGVSQNFALMRSRHLVFFQSEGSVLLRLRPITDYDENNGTKISTQSRIQFVFISICNLKQLNIVAVESAVTEIGRSLVFFQFAIDD